MAGKYNASKLKITIGVPPTAPATVITVFKGMSEEVSCSFDLAIAGIDVTSKYNNGFAESIPGLITGTISGEAIINNAVATGMYTSGDIMDMALSRQIKTMRIGTGDDDDPTEEFKGYFTSFSKSGEMEAAGRYSFEIAMTTRPVPVA